jgi:hypothetical protein
MPICVAPIRVHHCGNRVAGPRVARCDGLQRKGEVTGLVVRIGYRGAAGTPPGPSVSVCGVSASIG